MTHEVRNIWNTDGHTFAVVKSTTFLLVRSHLLPTSSLETLVLAYRSISCNHVFTLENDSWRSEANISLKIIHKTNCFFEPIIITLSHLQCGIEEGGPGIPLPKDDNMGFDSRWEGKAPLLLTNDETIVV